MRPFAVFIIVLNFIACGSHDSTGGPLPPQLFAKIYVEALQLRVDAPADSASALTQVLARHRISRAEFDRTVEFYNQNPPQWRAAVEEITRHLEQKAAADSNAAEK